MTDLNRRTFLSAFGLGLASTAVGTPIARAAGQRSDDDVQTSRPGPDPWVELDRAALRKNLRSIRDRSDNRPIMAVIKANAYGHGLTEFATMLADEGVVDFAIAKISEAMALREAGLTGTILSFGPYGPREIPEIVRHRISQTVFTDRVEDLAREARRAGRVSPVQVNVDTGLGRVGIPYREALPFLRRLAGLQGVRLEGVFTAFTEDPEFDRVQLSRFLDICASAEQEGIRVGLRHAASSAALMDYPEAFLDMLRPGIAVYGHYPSAGTWSSRPIELAGVLSLKTRVMYVKTLEAGESISYHRAFVADRRTRVATLPIGYSDGYPATAAGRTEVLIRGRRFGVVALVTSNHTIVNLGSEQEVEIGDEAVLIGRQGSDNIDAQTVADAAGVSVYKLLIGLNPALPRQVVAGI
jgi:alanine racemase